MIQVIINIDTTVVTVTPTLISDGTFSMANIDHTVILNRGVKTHAEIDSDLNNLSNVDNTSDLDKPISTATQLSLDLKSDTDSVLGNNLEILLASSSASVDQQPSTTDSPLKVEFGSAMGSPSEPIEMDALGNITFNQSDNYFIRVAVHFGRTGASGTSELRFRSVVNGSQIGETVGAKVGNSDEIIYLNVNIITKPEIGDVLHFEVMRDSSGNNSGGLFQLPVTPGDWSDAPSARILVQRFV